MPKFTPGKWAAGTCTNRNQRVAVVDDITNTTGKRIAEVHDQNAYLGGAHYLFPDHDEAVANAALIADAPVMYALLRELITGHPDLSLLRAEAEILITKHGD